MLKTEAKNSTLSVYLTQLRSKYGKLSVLFVVLAVLVSVTGVAGIYSSTRGRADAAALSTLNFQGRLLDSTGNVVADGTYNIQFNLYTVSSGGTTQWTESYLNNATQGVTMKYGYFSVQLGSLTSFPGTINWDQDQWLGMTVRGTGSCVFGSCTPADAEMTPRFKLTAVPYAFKAAVAANVASNDTSTVSTNSAGVSIVSGNASGATSDSGNITIDAGTATGTAGTVSLGASNASALTLGHSGIATAVQGSLTVAEVTSLNGDVTLGNALTDLVTISGTIQGTNALVFEGATADGFETTISVIDPTADVTLQIPALVAGTYDICTSSGNCLGTGDIIQGGNSYGAAVTIGTNDTYDLNFETSGVTRLTVNATTGNIALTSDLAVNGGDITSTGDLTVAPAGNDLILSANTTITGSSTGVALTANNSTSTGNILNLQDNGTNVLTVADGGAVVIQNSVDSASAFTIKNAAGVDILSLSSNIGDLRISRPGAYGGVDGLISFGTGSNSIGYYNNAFNFTNSLSISDPTLARVVVSNGGGSLELGVATSAGNFSNIAGVNDAVLRSNTSNLILTSRLNGGKVILASDTGGADSASLTVSSPTNVVLGSSAVNAVPSLFTLQAVRSTSTSNNIAGGDLAIAAGTGTGSANGGSLYFQTSAPGSSGNTQNSLTTVLTVTGGSGSIIAKNIANSTSAFTVQNASGASILNIDTTNGEVELGDSSTAGKLVVSDGSSNSVSLLASAMGGDYNLTIPALTGNDTICVQGLNNCGYIGSSLTDNTTDALDIQEGTNNYFNINTTDGSENISFGNATTNPSYNFLGSGTLTVDGDASIAGGLDVGGNILNVSNAAYFPGDPNGTTIVNGTLLFSKSTAATDSVALTGGITSEDPTSTPGDFLGADVYATIYNNLTTQDYSSSTAKAIRGIATLNAASTNVLNLIGVEGSAEIIGSSAGSTVLNAIALHATDTSATSGSITNGYGLFVENQTGATNDYGIYVAGADTYALFVDSGATRLDGTLDVNGLATLSAGLTASGADVNVNASSNFDTNINTGTSTGDIAIGNSAAGTITVQSASTIGLTGTTTITGLGGGSTKALVVNNSTSTGNILEVQDNGTAVFTIADGGNITATGALSLTGTNATTFTTPQGSPVNTKINIPSYDPGASGQILAFGLASGASASSRAISIFDNRATGGNQPALAIFSPDENSAVGFSWDGSNSTAQLVTTSGGSSNSAGINIISGPSAGATTTTGGVSIMSGAGVGTNTNTGSIIIDSGAKAGSGTAGTISIGTTNASAISLGRSGITTTNSGALTVSQLLTGSLGATISGATINLNDNSNFNTNINTGTSNGTVTIGNSAAGAITMQSASTININAPTIATNATTLALFNTNATTVTALQVATSVSIGATTGTLTVRNANTTLGNAAGSGLFTNNGATLNTTLAVANDSDGGALGGTPGSPLTAAQSVDVYTAIAINQTTGSQTITLPNPTSATAGRIIYISNVGSVSFVMGGITIANGGAQSYLWNGSAWVVTTTNIGVTSVGTIGSSPNANGASISGTTLTLQPADASFGGVVTTAAQTFAGAKTLSGQTLLSGTAANQTQLIVRANASQTVANPLVLFQNSGGTETSRITISGTRNQAFGYGSFGSLSSSTDSTGFGYNTLAALSSGVENTAFGSGALDAVNIGTWNVGIGVDAGGGITSGTGNTAIGSSALMLNSSWNTAIGRSALQYTTGADNVAIGATAGMGVNGSSTFAQSVILGSEAGQGLTAGGNNVLVGYQAGKNLTTGNNNIIIGTSVNASAVGVTDELRIGSGSTITLQANLSTKAAQFNGAVTVSPTANSVTALTVNGTSGTAATALAVAQAGAATGLSVTSSNTGLGQLVSLTNTSGIQTAGISIDRNGASGTTTSLLSLSNTAGTATNGILFTGTIGTDITTASGRNLTVVANGAGTINLNDTVTVTNDLTVDTNTLYVDSTNDVVGVGTLSPGAKLGVVAAGSDSSASALNVTNSSSETLAKIRNDGQVSLGTNRNTGTVGRTSLGATSDTSDRNSINAMKITAPAGGVTISSMSVYVSAVDSAPNNKYRVAIYSDSSGPTTTVATSAEGTLIANSWNTIAISATLSASGTYWLAYTTNGTSDSFNNMVYDTGAANSSCYKSQAYFTSFTSMVGCTSYNQYYSIYATSSASAGAVTISATGNVGVNTVTPGATLDVLGSARFVSATNGAGAFQVQSSTNVNLISVDTSTNAIIIGNTAAATPLTLGSATSTSTTLVQGGTGTGVSLQVASTGTIAIGSTTASTINVGTGAFAHTIAVGTDATTTQGITVGSISASSALTLRGGTGSGAIALQAGSGGTITIGASAASTVNIGTGAFAHTIAVGTDATTTQGVTVGSTSASSTTVINGGSAGTGVSIQVASTGAISIGSSAAATVNVGTGAFAHTVSIANNATAAQTVAIGSTFAGSTLTLGANGAISLAATGTNFTAGARTIDIAQSAASTVGGNLTVTAGQGGTGTGSVGGTLVLQGGGAGGTTANGGGVTITGGAATGSGTAQGLVNLSSTAFSTAPIQTFSSSGVTATTAGYVDSYSTLPITASTTGAIDTLTDPVITTIGRILYVAARSGSNDLTLRLNSSRTPIDITLKANSTATLIWNGTDWTAAGASSSTDLQAAYNNTATSAGGAELVLNASGGAADGLTVRNNATTPIIGGIFEAQTSVGSNIFSVNNNATEYAVNGGAETSTNFSTNWLAAPAGGTITRNTTSPTSTVATGQASVSVVTTATASHGARNLLSSQLTNSLKYNVSYTVRASSSTTSFSTLETMFSSDGTATAGNVRACVSGTPTYFTGTASQSTTTITGSGTTFTAGMVGQIFVFANGASALITGYTDATHITTSASYSQTVASQSYNMYNAGNTVKAGAWSRVSCTFTAPASGMSANNSIFIRQTDATARTFYIDNLSVTVSADVNHAVDGSVDDSTNFATNWTQIGGATVARNTSNIYDTSASASVVTTATIGHGIRNNMAITPSVSTQYLITFYAKSSNTFSDIRVRYSRDGGTNFVSCGDYNTQSVSTTAFTRITCLLTTDSTTATNPDLVIDQPTATARTFYVDALSVTLNTNNSNNVQVGAGANGGPVTLFTLDRAASSPIAANNDAYLGSMYYDTTSGRIQCYEADGWGACGSAPDNYVNLNPEYAGAVLNGSGVGTMTADFCANQVGVLVVGSLCATGESRNFYKWTSPQASPQTYSIYVSYQLPATFKGFASDDTVQLTGRTSSTTDGSVTYEMFKNESGALTACGSSTAVTSVANTWQTVGVNGNEATGCNFSTASANAFVIFKINVTAQNNANVYVGTLGFTTTGR